MDDGAGQSRSGEKRPAFWTGMTIFYEQRPKYGARDETRYIDTPVGLCVDEGDNRGAGEFGGDLCDIGRRTLGDRGCSHLGDEEQHEGA